MRIVKKSVVAVTILVLSCLRHDNPFDITAPNYNPPEVFIASDTVQDGDTTACAAFSVSLSGNRPEVSVRWRLDTLAWSNWQKQDTVAIGGYDTGRHVITAQGWYGEGGEVDTASISFVKVMPPTVTTDTSSLLGDSLVPVTAGTRCTLMVHAEGSGELSFFWYHDTALIDTAGGKELVVGPFVENDTGAYFVIVRNKWGADTSDTVFLRYTLPVNHPPVAAGDSFTVEEDGELNVTAAQGILKNDTDVDEYVLVAVLVDSTLSGELTLNENGTFSYKPDKDFRGADSFTYKARDKKGALSSAVTVQLTITAVNDAPEVANNSTVTLDEGQRVTITATVVSVIDIDNSASEIIYTPTRRPAAGNLFLNDTTVSASGMFTQKNIDDGLVSYRHDGSETTADTAILSVRDGNGGRIDTVRLLFDITPVNDTPYFATKLDLTVTEGGTKTIGTATLQIKDNDNAPAELVFTLGSIAEHGSILKNGTALDAGATFSQQDIDSSRIVYQHDKSNTTRDSLSFTVSDGSGGTIGQTWLVIRVGAVDDPPIAIDQGVSTNEDTPLEVTLTATDPEGVTITGWEITRQPMHGAISGSGSTRTYTPGQDFSGADTFLFRGNDGVNWSDTGIIAVTVLPVNDAPVWKQGVTELSAKEGKAASLDLSTVFDKDPEGDQITFSKKAGVGSVSGTVWSWTPGYTAAASSPANCVITVTDNGLPKLSSDITLTIAVQDSFCGLTTKVTSAPGSGSIVISPASITGSDYEPNKVIMLSAIIGSDTNYIFNKWSGDIENTDPFSSTIEITLNYSKTITASFVLKQQTILLSHGESGFHGLLYCDGYIYGTTRTSPARIIRFKADDISVYEERIFPVGFDGAEQIVYASSTNKLYTIFNHASRTVIAEIDPFSLEFTTDKILDTMQGIAKGAGQSMATDGNDLYAITFPDYGLTRIVKYSLSTSKRIGHLDLESDYNLGHAIRCHDGMLYLTGITTPSWVAKVSPSPLSLVEGTFIPTSGGPTDDFGISGRYLFVGTESSHIVDGNGIIYRYQMDNLSIPPTVSFTGEKRSEGGLYSGQCFAVQENGKYIWALFATSPKGILTRIDPQNPNDIQNYQLEYQYPNEITFDGKRFFITYWDLDPAIIQAFEPSYLNGREIP